VGPRPFGKVSAEPWHILLKSETVLDNIRIYAGWLKLGKLCVPARQK